MKIRLKRLGFLCAMIVCAGIVLASGAQAVAVPAPQQAYSLLTYTPSDTIRIQYPQFSGAENDALNTLVLDYASQLVPADLDLSTVTIDYQAAVTLYNAKIASIVFWGDSDVEGSIHPFSDLFALNVDLSTLAILTVDDLFTVDGAFQAVLFEKAFFPTEPVTAYTADTFAEPFAMLNEMYQSIGLGGELTCFFKPDGVVFSLPSIHASGSDHLEAELRYADVQPFYIPAQNYWED